MPALIDISGRIFGRLRVMGRARTKGKEVAWSCECECGRSLDVIGKSLRGGYTRSCGCLRSDTSAVVNYRHGHSRRRERETRTYRTWAGMISRCRHPTNTSYQWYGALGVSVCARWSDFRNFLSDMGEAPAGLSIDRIDPFGDYEPSNCRWATAIEQRHNQRRHHIMRDGIER